MSATVRQREEFVARIVAEYGHYVSPGMKIPAVYRGRHFARAMKLVTWCRKMMRLGATHHRLSLAQSNRGRTDDEERALDQCELRICKLCEEQMNCKPVFSDDPRGATVKLELPSGKSNAFAGGGWCVPGS